MLLAEILWDRVPGAIVICVICFLAQRNFKRLIAGNAEVADAAKKAATQKAIGLIAKWLK